MRVLPSTPSITTTMLSNVTSIVICTPMIILVSPGKMGDPEGPMLLIAVVLVTLIIGLLEKLDREHGAMVTH